MSKWNHAMCDECWNKRMEEQGEPGRIAVRMLKERKSNNFRVDVCCYCNAKTQGIYVRDRPEEVPCGGTAGTHFDDE